MTTTREEFLVTGNPGNGYPLYTFVYSEDKHDDPKASALKFMDSVGANLYSPPWHAGPFLHKRTITTSDWEEVTDV